MYLYIYLYIRCVFFVVGIILFYCYLNIGYELIYIYIIVIKSVYSLNISEKLIIFIIDNYVKIY